MLAIPVYNETGEKVGDESLDPALLGGDELNAALLKQAIVMYHANKRLGTVAQKTRSEVEGSTRKLYRQKGTGRARMGNARQPVRRGGGNAFPRKPRDFSQAMPKKMKRLARNQAVLAKIRSEQALILDGMTFDAPKTKRMAAALAAVKAVRGCVLAHAGEEPTLYLGSRNIPRAELLDVRELNAGVNQARRHLIFTRKAFDAFRTQLGK